MMKVPPRAQARSKPARRRVVSRAARASDPKVVSTELPLARPNRAERAAERRKRAEEERAKRAAAEAAKRAAAEAAKRSAAEGARRR